MTNLKAKKRNNFSKKRLGEGVLGCLKDSRNCWKIYLNFKFIRDTFFFQKSFKKNDI